MDTKVSRHGPEKAIKTPPGLSGGSFYFNLRQGQPEGGGEDPLPELGLQTAVVPLGDLPEDLQPPAVAGQAAPPAAGDDFLRDGVAHPQHQAASLVQAADLDPAALLGERAAGRHGIVHQVGQQGAQLGGGEGRLPGNAHAAVGADGTSRAALSIQRRASSG